VSPTFSFSLKPGTNKSTTIVVISLLYHSSNSFQPSPVVLKPSSNSSKRNGLEPENLQVRELVEAQSSIFHQLQAAPWPTPEPEGHVEASTNQSTGVVVDWNNPALGTAGGRFWNMLKNERPEYYEIFMKKLFDVRTPTESEVVGQHSLIRPYYRAGMMAGEIRVGEEDVVQFDNVFINTSAMLVNREFRDAGSRLFYGRPRAFMFEDPINAKWWCKRIGEVNFSNLDTLVINLTQGWRYVPSLYLVSTLDRSEEEKWNSFFTWLKPRHQLRRLFIDFDKWDSVDELAEVDIERHDDLVLWRNKLRNTLFEFRGLRDVDLRNTNQVAFTPQERNNHSLAMIQRRGTGLPPPQPQQPKMNLADTLQYLKQQREMDALLKKREERRQGRRTRDGTVW
jgi:hypothetical protein